MSQFTLSRTVDVAAEPARVHAHLDDFRAWQTWSPWEGLDPELTRTYSGAEAGVGARYHWSGNSKAGEGTMEIVESAPSTVVVDLAFLKPFRARNESRFDLTPSGEGTRVVWTMTGTRNPLMQVLGKLFFDKKIAQDFEKGLADLKTVVEAK
jgi:hypothetical protein